MQPLGISFMGNNMQGVKLQYIFADRPKREWCGGHCGIMPLMIFTSEILIVFVTVFCLAVETDCSASPRLSPYVIQEPYEEIFNTPDVVVGLVLSDIAVGTPIGSNPQGQYPLQPRRLDVSVGIVLPRFLGQRQDRNILFLISWSL